MDGDVDCLLSVNDGPGENVACKLGALPFIVQIKKPHVDNLGVNAPCFEHYNPHEVRHGPTLQRWVKRRALGCEKLLPDPAWLLLSETGPTFSPPLHRHQGKFVHHMLY